LGKSDNRLTQWILGDTTVDLIFWIFKMPDLTALNSPVDSQGPKIIFTTAYEKVSLKVSARCGGLLFKAL